MSTRKSLVLRWVIGLGLVGYLFTLIDFQEFLHVFSRCRVKFVILSVLIVLFDRIWMASKWKILLNSQNVRVPLFQCVRVYFVASFVGLVLPTSVGSDLYRLMDLSVEKGEREKVAASIIVEKALSMFALFVLCSLSIFLLVWTSPAHPWKYVFLALAIFGGILGIFILSLKFFPNKRLKKFDGKIFQILAKIGSAYQQFGNYKGAMILFFVVSFFEQLMPFVFNYVLAIGFNLPGTLVDYFMIVPLIYVVARIPISVDGVGVLESMFLLLLPMVGLSKTDALLLALAGRMSTTLGHLIGGIFYFTWKQK